MPLSTDSQAHSFPRHHPPPKGAGSDGLCVRFQVLFHPPGYFSPFPHGTCPLSVTRKYSGLPGGPADSQQISRARCYLGHAPNETTHFDYRTLTVYGRPFQATSAWGMQLSHCLQHGSTRQNDPTTPHAQPLPSITCAWFSLIRFLLATTHGITIVFFPWVLRCFTSPRSLHTAYTFNGGNTTSPVLRVSHSDTPDHSSADRPSRFIAASHVLHRSSGTKASTERPYTLQQQ